MWHFRWSIDRSSIRRSRNTALFCDWVERRSSCNRTCAPFSPDSFSNRWIRSHWSTSHSCRCHISFGSHSNATWEHNDSQSLSRLWKHKGYGHGFDRQECRCSVICHCTECSSSVDRNCDRHETCQVDMNQVQNQHSTERNECNRSREDIWEGVAAKNEDRPKTILEDRPGRSRKMSDRSWRFDSAIRTQKLDEKSTERCSTTPIKLLSTYISYRRMPLLVAWHCPRRWPMSIRRRTRISIEPLRLLIPLSLVCRCRCSLTCWLIDHHFCHHLIVR